MPRIPVQKPKIEVVRFLSDSKCGDVVRFANIPFNEALKTQAFYLVAQETLCQQ